MNDDKENVMKSDPVGICLRLSLVLVLYIIYGCSLNGC